MKTKPTQASVKELQGMGIQPDILVCRSEYPLGTGIKDKTCSVSVMFLQITYCRIWTLNILYEAPLAMEEEHLAQVVCECLHLNCPEPDLKRLERNGELSAKIQTQK